MALATTSIEPVPETTPRILKASSLTVSSLAVVHIACWASSVVLGVVAFWILNQSTQGWENSFFGRYGVPIWSSIPFALCGVLSIVAAKTRSNRTVTWFMALSVISLLFAMSTLAFSALAVANEATIEVYPKRLIVAGITTLVSFVEVIVSVSSFIVCYNAIKFNLQFSSKKKISRKNRQVGPSDDEGPSHVTVMALPPREAAELFLNMYRPGSTTRPMFIHPGMEAFMGGETVNHFPEPPMGEQKRYSSPDDRRRHRKRHHRRSHSRNESPEDSIGDNNATADGDDFDNDWNVVNMIHHPKSFVESPQNRSEDPTQSPNRPYSQTRLETVPEDDHDTTLPNEVPPDQTDGEAKTRELRKEQTRAAIKK